MTKQSTKIVSECNDIPCTHCTYGNPSCHLCHKNPPTETVSEFATLKEAKAKCESYYDLYDQLRNCTCGHCLIKNFIKKPNPPTEPMGEKWEEIWERVYDNPINEDGTKKPNKLFGKFHILQGAMDDYSYRVIAVGEDKKYYQIIGHEVSGYYHPNQGGTRNELDSLDWLNTLLTSSVQEAKADERERIKRIFYPMNKEDLLPIGKAIDEWVKLHEELGGEVVWQSMGDSEYDRPRPIRAIYHTPLKIFHGMMGIGDDLLTSLRKGSV